MVQAGEVIVVLSFLAWAATIYSLVQAYRLAEALKVPGIGRILFVWMGNLQLWAFLAMAFFLVNTLAPAWAGDHTWKRVGIRVFFGVYLLGTNIGVTIALHRWRNHAAGN